MPVALMPMGIAADLVQTEASVPAMEMAVVFVHRQILPVRAVCPAVLIRIVTANIAHQAAHTVVPLILVAVGLVILSL